MSTSAKPTTKEYNLPNNLTVIQFRALSDNYGYLVHKGEHTAAIDTPDASLIHAILAHYGFQLTHILNTHHHADHAGGNADLLSLYPDCEVVGPANERIPCITTPAGENDVVFNSLATVYDTPGHTSGHIVYHFADSGALFCGDTLFAMGCGRLFEGTPAQMWSSIRKLKALPDDTLVFCAHEYTLANAKFAVTADVKNENLAERYQLVQKQREKDEWTVPTTIRLEKSTNPFMRADEPSLQAHFNTTDPVETFAKVRHAKDVF